MRQRDWLGKSCGTRNSSLNTGSLCGAKRHPRLATRPVPSVPLGPTPIPVACPVLCGTGSASRCPPYTQHRGPGQRPACAAPAGPVVCAGRGSTGWHGTPEIKTKHSGFPVPPPRRRSQEESTLGELGERVPPSIRLQTRLCCSQTAIKSPGSCLPPQATAERPPRSGA